MSVRASLDVTTTPEPFGAERSPSLSSGER
jgi:hypothetical protein